MMATTKTKQTGTPEDSVTRRNINHLPSELLHMICVYLEPRDIATIRVLDRIIAEVGLQYLVSQIHLIPKPDSFDRLLAVAEHPLASRYVNSLFYEADLLRSFRHPQEDRELWEKSLVGPSHASPLEEVQDPHFASACGHLPKRYNRGTSAVVLSHQQHYTKRELQRAYQTYRSYRAEQHRLNESAAYEEAMVRAMKRLPHLTSILISCERGNTNHFRAAFEAGLCEDVTSDPRMADQICASQLSLLLSAADKAGLQIKKLVCGSLGQIFLSCSLERLDAMQRSIQSLHNLHLFFSHIPVGFDSNAASNPHGSSSARADNMQFAMSAPNLETLSIRFDKDRALDPPDLKHLVSDFHWSYLASATFAKMSTGSEILVGFCDRHAGTLKDLSLTDISLYSGRWATTFYEMRQRLKLDKMALAGIIQSVEGDYWNFEIGDHTTKLMIERYIAYSDESQRDLSLGRFIMDFRQALAKRWAPHRPSGLSAVA
ncbi:hypothetical protein HO173_012188 [Letharia columbiana]|uniref:F-box domain-containing protein n=1 Tax=Letharia columbiana TaxID=112416 RepID=A0A8H6CQ09_9LECA|nr:uncharacterized protein HO173_012188 [Letharia columbiana]KAF6227549.1 hypothetical protein HO173_012188 [Letharia columbiana]